jgi:hypothetical protein
MMASQTSTKKEADTVAANSMTRFPEGLGGRIFDALLLNQLQLSENQSKLSDKLDILIQLMKNRRPSRRS